MRHQLNFTVVLKEASPAEALEEAASLMRTLKYALQEDQHLVNASFNEHYGDPHGLNTRAGATRPQVPEPKPETAVDDDDPPF